MSRNRMSVLRQRLGRVWNSVTGAGAGTRNTNPNPRLLNYGISETEDELQVQLREEEDFQLALALSRSEAEADAYNLNDNWCGTPKNETKVPASVASIVYEVDSKIGSESDLSQYMSKSYWNNPREYWTVGGAVPSAPSPSEFSFFSTRDESEPTAVVNKFKNIDSLKEAVVTIAEIPCGGFDDDEARTLNLVSSLTSQVEAMMLRIQSDLSRGRRVDSDFGLYEMFKNISAKHTDVVNCLKEWETKRGNFAVSKIHMLAFCERLQDNITRIRLLREALDTMRLENSVQIHRQWYEERQSWKQQLERKVAMMKENKYNSIMSDCKTLPKHPGKPVLLAEKRFQVEKEKLPDNDIETESAIPADLFTALEEIWSKEAQKENLQ